MPICILNDAHIKLEVPCIFIYIYINHWNHLEHKMQIVEHEFRFVTNIPYLHVLELKLNCRIGSVAYK